MKHYTREEWIDFARGLVGSEAKSLMQLHLDSGCHECQREAGLWARVSQTAQREAHFEPPPGAVRIAKAMMATSGYRAKARPRLAELLFDSIRTPLPAGVRSAMAVSRQMLFGSGNHRIDLRMEPKLDSDEIAIVGQLLDSANPEQMLRNVPVTLHSGKKMVAASETNHLGEFQLICKLSNDLELRATLPQGQQIRLALIEIRKSTRDHGSYLADPKDDIATRGNRKRRTRKDDRGEAYRK
jgi:hypothetical protein